MAQGPSSSATPYLVGTRRGVDFTSIITSGDTAPGTTADGESWQFVGIPDGIGVLDNGDGTVKVLVNHEIGNTLGVVRDHGSIGSFVSELTVDKATFAVTAADDLAETLYLDEDGDGTYLLAPAVTDPAQIPAAPNNYTTGAIGRLCSGDLADVTAYFNAESGKGTTDRIYLAGEEVGPEGRLFGFIVTGDEAGDTYELPSFGEFSWENAIASPIASDKTVVVSMDDTTPGQVYVYVGEKQLDDGTQTAVELAGLVGGTTYGIKAAGIGTNPVNPIERVLNGTFELAEIAGASTLSGAGFEAASDAAGVSEWFRPEDGQWDTVDPNRFYFVTTASFDNPSRLWALDFVDATDPTLGGTFTALLDGTEGHRMLDNMTVTSDGLVVLQEDPGNQPYLARIHVYDPATDRIYEIAEHDPSRFLAGGTNSSGFTQDEESSGVVEVTDTFGDADTYAFMLDVQAHTPFAATGSQQQTEIVERGQLLLMTVEKSLFDNSDSDSILGTAADESFRTRTGNDTVDGAEGNDTIKGDGDNDLLLGGDGDDRLNGQDGSDTIEGGLGADRIIGGVGYDVIRYNTTAEGGDSVKWEQIDQIEISAAGFGGDLMAGANIGAEGRFETVDVDGPVTQATTAAGLATFILNFEDRGLYFDQDGSGVMAAELIGFFKGVSVTASDITIIA